MSLARRHRDYIQSLTAATAVASAPDAEDGLSPVAVPPTATGAQAPVSTAAHQIALRLQHDLRRLKDIKAVTGKVIAKRDMLAEYRAWCDGLLEAGRAAGRGPLAPTGADEVLPTVMVWCIDVGDWSRALELAAHVLRHDVALPARYQRDAATLVLEEIAEAALKAQALGHAFPLDVLEEVEALVDGIDMHDEPRAKLLKAIGVELARDLPAIEGVAARARAVDAIARLQAAQALHDRVGVKTQIKALEKLVASIPAPDATAPGIAAAPSAFAGIADTAVSLHTILTGLREGTITIDQIASGDFQIPTGVGGIEAPPAPQTPEADMSAAKDGNDATTSTGD